MVGRRERGKVAPAFVVGLGRACVPSVRLSAGLRENLCVPLGGLANSLLKALGRAADHLAAGGHDSIAYTFGLKGAVDLGVEALQQRDLRRDVAVSVTNFLAVPEMVAVTDYGATLPRLICRRLEHDPRLKILPAPVDLGTFPVEIAWHVRYRNDPAHRWLRGLVADVAREISAAPQ